MRFACITYPHLAGALDGSRALYPEVRREEKEYLSLRHFVDIVCFVIAGGGIAYRDTFPVEKNEVFPTDLWLRGRVYLRLPLIQRRINDVDHRNSSPRGCPLGISHIVRVLITRDYMEFEV